MLYNGNKFYLFNLVFFILIISNPPLFEAQPLSVDNIRIEIQEQRNPSIKLDQESNIQFNFTVAFVVDHSFYLNSGPSWTNTTGIIANFINHANFAFNNNSMPINLEFAELYVLSDQTDSDNKVGTAVDGNFVISDFRDYINGNASLGQYDFVQLLTTRVTSPLGSAYVGNIIPQQISYISAISTYSNTFNLVFTHMIGHNLGARHDDDLGCTNGDYIMRSSINPFAWEFSSCSKTSILASLKGEFGDNAAPEITGPTTSSNISLGSEIVLSFTATDLYPLNYDYYINNVSIFKNSAWSNDTIVKISILGEEVQIYNVTIIFKDFFYQTSSYTVLVNVQDIFIPEIVSNDFYNFVEGGENIVPVTISDYAVWIATAIINGTQVNYEKWFNVTTFYIDFSFYQDGVYNLTITASDYYWNYNEKTIWVTIQENDLINSPKETITTIHTVTETVTEGDPPQDAFVGIAIYVIITPLAVVSLIKKKKHW